MDFLVKVGETGLSFPYTNISPNEKISYLQAKIRTDTRIEIKDQVLITKKGHRLQSNDIFSNLDKESQFQATISKNDNPLKSVFTIYVFDQKRCQDKASSRDKFSPFFLDGNEALKNYLLEAKIIDKDYTADFQAQNAESAVIETIRGINPEILNTDNKVFTAFNSIKKKYLMYKGKVKRLSRLMEESGNQVQSFEVLLKHASLNYTSCKNRKGEIEKRFEQDQERNNAILKGFEDGLENLKKIELHEALQTDKQRYLIDVYYSRDAMYKWRDTCIEFQDNVKNKIERSSTRIEAIKKKFKDEKDGKSEVVEAQLKAQNVNMDSLLQEEETILLPLVKRCYEDYRTVRETLDDFAQNPDSNSRREALTDSKMKAFEDKTWDEEILTLTKNGDKIDKILDQITKMKFNLENPVMVFYNTIMKYVGELNMISSEKMRQLNEEIDKMERDFGYLLNPNSLPKAYKHSLAEVSRRREFRTTFEEKYKALKETLDTEVDKRKKFLSEYGKVLPSDFIPQLKNIPILTLQNLEIDANLPLIENVLSAEKQTNDALRTPPKSKRGFDEFERRSSDRKSTDKIKGDDDTKGLKKKVEDLMKVFEVEKERNNLLKVKLNEMEKDKLTTSLRKDISKEEVIKRKDTQQLQEDLDQLSRIVDKCLASLNGPESQVNGVEASKDSSQETEKQQLVQKVDTLTAMIQQVSKTAFGVFSRNLEEKQKRFDDVKTKYENLLMKAEENLQREAVRVETYYEGKMSELSHKYSDAQRKLTAMAEDAKRYQRELAELKLDSHEKSKYYQAELDSIKKDVKIKLDILKSKDEIIKSLTDIKMSQAKDIAEFQEKMRKLEHKHKTEQTQAVENLHNLHKGEIDSWKSRLKNLDRDISNKNIELEKVGYNLAQNDKDLKQKESHIQKLETSIGSLNTRITKMHDEIATYQNKIDNLELTLQKKTTELSGVTKQLTQITNEKNTVSKDLLTYKEFNNELTKRVQSTNEAFKKAENDRKTLKSENDSLLVEVDKKQVEIQSIKEQVERITKERRDQIEELNKITETHQTEKSKISTVQEELNQRNAEINALKTKLDLSSFDLDNKVKENKVLVDKVEALEKDKERAENDLQRVTKDLEEERGKLQELEQKRDDLKVVCEQLQIELEMKDVRCEELKKEKKDLSDRLEKAEGSLAQSAKENELLSQQNYERSSEGDAKVQGMKEQVLRLEEELRQKEKEIVEKEEEAKEAEVEKANMQERLEDMTEQYEKDRKILVEKEEKLKELGGDSKNEQMIIKELEKQEEFYKEEITNKQEEIAGIKKQNQVITEENERIRNENFLLSSELTSQKSHVETLNANYQLEALSKLDYLKVESGAKLLFIPYSAGIYVPFTLHQFANHELEAILKSGKVQLDMETLKKTESSIKPAFFLDLESVSETYQNILMDCSLLIVGTVRDIKSKLNKDINPKEEVLMIGLEKIEYMVGFEDEEMILKNYALTLN